MCKGTHHIAQGRETSGSGEERQEPGVITQWERGNKGRDVFVIIVVILQRQEDRGGTLWGNPIIGQCYQKHRGRNDKPPQQEHQVWCSGPCG
jgi:hypothetical protein